MCKLINNTDSIGPYPGRTWQDEADAVGDSPFAYMVTRQIEEGVCDDVFCGREVDAAYHFCSKGCYDAYLGRVADEGEAEARVS